MRLLSMHLVAILCTSSVLYGQQFQPTPFPSGAQLQPLLPRNSALPPIPISGQSQVRQLIVSPVSDFYVQEIPVAPLYSGAQLPRTMPQTPELQLDLVADGPARNSLPKSTPAVVLLGEEIQPVPPASSAKLMQAGPRVAMLEPAIVLDGQTRCLQLSEQERDHTYIFIVNGLDPLFLGKLNKFSASIQAAGFRNVYLLPMRGQSKTKKKICNVRQSDPAAKIVLMGYSWGANEVRSICHNLKKKDIYIDLLVYLGGDMVGNRPYSRPDNALKVLNVNAHGLMILGGDLFWNGNDIDGATNVRLGCLHLWIPKNPKALDLVLNEIADVASPPIVIKP